MNAPRLLCEAVEHGEREKDDAAEEHEAQRRPQLDEAVGQDGAEMEVVRAKVQHAAAHRHEHQREQDREDQADGVKEHLGLMAEELRGTPHAVGLAHAQQQRVGRAHREPDGKDQAEGHQRPARYARNVAQVLDQQVQHLGGDDGAELAQEALNVHGEEADEVAQEDEQREHRKEQVIRQRRAVAGHAVVEVAAHEQRRAAKKPVVHHALEQIPLTSALFILHEAL